MSKREQLLRLFAKHRILDASTIRAAQIPTQLVTDIVRSGVAMRLERGVYSLMDAPLSEISDLEILARRVPNGVICLVSALRFYGLTDENPHVINMALRHGSHAPSISYPPVQFSCFSGDAFTHGVEFHRVEGIEIRVYSIAKTIADCFKYRNKIGLDIGVTALREAAEKNILDYNELWDAAKICRVTKIIRPYMEIIQ